MENLQVFNNKQLGLKVRAIKNEDGSISVNAEDTAIGFGWTQTEVKNGKTYTTVKWSRINKFIKDLGFDHECTKELFIPESLFYLLGMKANNDKAKRFQQWLAVDVIPDIRKNGMYATENTIDSMLNNPDFAITLLTKYKEEKEERKRLQEENKKKDGYLIELGKKTSFVDDFLNKDDLYSIDSVSKTFAIKNLGRNNFYKYLRENKIVQTDTYTDYKGRQKSGLKHFTAFAQYTNAQQYFKHRQREFRIGANIKHQDYAMFTSKGINWIYKRLQKDGYVITKDLETIIEELENAKAA